MTMIEEVDKVVYEFLRRTLKVKGDRVKVIKTTKSNGWWEAEAEVYEENLFIRALGLPVKVQDKNTYTVKVDDNLDVLSFQRQGRGGGEEAE